MPALSTGTYGKGSTVTLREFADRLTAVLETGLAAVEELDRGTATGAPVDQAQVNTLRKVHGDLGALATDARNAAAEDAQKEADAKAAKPTTGSATPSGTGTAKS